MAIPKSAIVSKNLDRESVEPEAAPPQRHKAPLASSSAGSEKPFAPKQEDIKNDKKKINKSFKVMIY